MKPTISIRKALSDPHLLGNVLVGDSWKVWKTLLIAAMGESLTDEERAIFKHFTGGREHEPGACVNELAIVAGRRGGKSRSMALLATYIAGLVDHSDVLVRGETGTLLCIAQTQGVAKVVLDHCEAMFEDSPILRQLIKARSANALELTNGIVVEVRPASFRKLRGPTYVGVICDELAYWFTDSSYANPNSEILAAARPGLLSTHGMLIMASSPYAKRGELWNTYKKHYGPDGAPTILVAKGTSKEFNSTLDQAEIDRALDADRPRNTAEYLAEFRSDIESYIGIEVIESCVGDYREMLPATGTRYRAFVDPSGGSADSFTLSIAHKLGDQIIIDAVRERRPPFSPDNVVAEFATLLKSYKVTKVTGDRYGGEFCKELFKRHGIAYEPAAKPKSDLYQALLPLLNAGRITLPRNERLIVQLVGLERQVSRGGKDSISHGPNAHDDVANAVAGAASIAIKGGYSIDNFVRGSENTNEVLRELERAEYASYIMSGGRRF